MGSGIGSLKEWALEGEPNEAVGETERILRYQIKHMIVCDERMQDIASSRVAPQEIFTLVPAKDSLG